jgi:RNA polymerase sigma factor (sigma-70 family)
MGINDSLSIIENSQDEALWMQFKAGDETAFYEIYDKYIDLLYNYGVKFTPDYGLVEDCIHDLFINLWENRANIGHVKQPKFYLYISLRRKIIRSEQRKNRYITEDHGETRFSLRITGSVEDTLILEQAAADRANHLNKAISGLSARQREIIFLKYYENFSSEEIASIMSINIESVYKLSTKALNAIRNLIKEGVIFISFSSALLLLA